jgi:hypothetical protein
MGTLFSQFLGGEKVTLQTRGDSVQPPGTSGPVDWLSTAFKTLTLDVILPGEKLQVIIILLYCTDLLILRNIVIVQVIEEINLNDLQVTLKSQDQAFLPPTSSQHTVAKYKNPFGFSLQVVEAGQTIIMGSHGVDIAQVCTVTSEG